MTEKAVVVPYEVQRELNAQLQREAALKSLRNMKVKQELPNILFEAIEEIKPPSPTKEALMYFLLSLLGGIGLGIFLAFRHIH